MPEGCDVPEGCEVPVSGRCDRLLMTTQYYTAPSIDGFIADADNSLDWLFQFGEVEGMAEEYPRFLADVGALAMGSTTYTWIAEHTGFLEDPARWEYTLPTWVFSTRDLPRPAGPDIRLVSGDVRPVHAAMVRAAAGKNLWLVGGGELVGQFHDAGLLDEVILGVAPVFLGSEAPLLPRSITTPPLELVEVAAYARTFVSLRYRVPRG
jgi:dihydrofolate reductase